MKEKEMKKQKYVVQELLFKSEGVNNEEEKHNGQSIMGRRNETDVIMRD